MEWNLVKGNTYTVDVTAGTLLFYKTGEHDGILVDTGYAREDREPLIRLFEETGVRPIGIIVSHLTTNPKLTIIEIGFIDKLVIPSKATLLYYVS